ncbi:hypothetical protein Glove_14g45 [Diversispora epigaea]|uniref:AN1-type domain-containing protein n=1 Tax=Diversispora epigaea TaxID=1348612 RepID=A0A397JP45_9GLOM|nr:hypothetical protein Glove_14g45 [Diversispora epigaea]
MEFFGIGKNCSLEGCKQLDFLPFLCACCKLKFCLDHRYPTSHNCLQWRENEKNISLCPKCSSMLLISSEISSEEAKEKIVEEHLNSNCSLYLLSSMPSTTRKKCLIQKDCNNNNNIHVVCDGCGEIFCLKHRYPSIHECPSLNVHAETKAKRREMAEELIAKYFKKPLSPSGNTTINAKTATIQPKKKKENKMVKLMVLKSNAKGDSSIPPDSRLYLTIEFPRDSNIASKPMFFNKNWTIGKVLDKIATEGKIKNVNNQLSMEDPERLILYNSDSEKILNTEQKLDDSLSNGDFIGLEIMNKYHK